LFVEPTVFIDVDPGMTVVREEIFGPVAVLLPDDGGDDGAVQLANDSTYGLAGTVWSADMGHAIDVARRIDTGIVGINSWTWIGWTGRWRVHCAIRPPLDAAPGELLPSTATSWVTLPSRERTSDRRVPTCVIGAWFGHLYRRARSAVHYTYGMKRFNT
jgi:hypothetical protein